MLYYIKRFKHCQKCTKEYEKVNNDFSTPKKSLDRISTHMKHSSVHNTNLSFTTK